MKCDAFQIGFIEIAVVRKPARVISCLVSVPLGGTDDEAVKNMLSPDLPIIGLPFNGNIKLG